MGSTIRVSQLLAALSALAAGVVLLWALRATRNAPMELFVDRLAAQKAQAAAVQTAAEAAAPSETEQAPASSEPSGEEEQASSGETEKREE